MTLEEIKQREKGIEEEKLHQESKVSLILSCLAQCIVLGLEEERRLAEEKAKRDEEVRLEQLSEDEFEALSEEVKAQIDARRLKARKERIRQLVEMIIYLYCSHIHQCVFIYTGEEKNNRNCYNKNKQWKRPGKKRKAETSIINKMYY